MADPTERYKSLADQAEADVRRLANEVERELPVYPRGAGRLSQKEQHQDYLQARDTPGGLQLRLREWRQQFGLRRAASYFVDWVRENERD